MTDVRYDDLMARRTLIREAWMRRVEEARPEHVEGTPPPFIGRGIVLGKDGSLRAIAYCPGCDQILFELTSQPFSTEIQEYKP